MQVVMKENDHSVVVERKFFFFEIFPHLNHITDDQSGLLACSGWNVGASPDLL